jgi:hypothetical protein
MKTRLAFQGLGGDLTVDLAAGLDRDGVAAACHLLLPGWRQVPAVAGRCADIAIAIKPGGYELAASSWSGGVAVAGDINNLANALGGLFIDALLARHSALCCLHAATVTIAGQAVLCVGRSQAGKSTLALRFAARGHRILGDDRILVDTGSGEAIALGLTVKARLPLPPGEALAAFTAQRTVMSDGNVSYLHLRPDEQAAFGDRAKIAAIVMVERDAAITGPVSVDRLAPGPLAAGLIGEATVPGAAASVVAAMTRLARAVGGRRLRFSDGDQAVDALLRELAHDRDTVLT